MSQVLFMKKKVAASGYRYWRVETSLINTSGILQFQFLKFYNDSTVLSPENMTANNAPSPNVVEANAELSATYRAYKAFDGNTGTRWYSDASGHSHWIEWDAGAGNTPDVNKVGISPWLNSYSPRDFKLQYSDDGASWTDLITVTGEVTANWTTKVERTFT